jgi:hypothetical protein
MFGPYTRYINGFILSATIKAMTPPGDGATQRGGVGGFGSQKQRLAYSSSCGSLPNAIEPAKTISVLLSFDDLSNAPTFIENKAFQRMSADYYQNGWGQSHGKGGKKVDPSRSCDKGVASPDLLFCHLICFLMFISIPSLKN